MGGEKWTKEHWCCTSSLIRLCWCHCGHGRSQGFPLIGAPIFAFSWPLPMLPAHLFSSGPKRLQADPGVQRETPGSSWLCLCRSLIPKARLVSQFRPCCCQLDFSAHLFRAFGLSFHLYPHIISGFLLCILLCFLMKPWKRKSLQTLQVAQ